MIHSIEDLLKLMSRLTVSQLSHIITSSEDLDLTMTTLRMLPRALLLLTLGLSQLQAFMVQQSVKHGHVPLALHPSSQTPATIENENGNGSSRRNPFAAASLAVTLTFGAMVAPCLAVSGGGLDYAGTDISGQDFSNANYKGKDFTQGTFE
jgi:hypothetical protein